MYFVIVDEDGSKGKKEPVFLGCSFNRRFCERVSDNYNKRQMDFRDSLLPNKILSEQAIQYPLSRIVDSLKEYPKLEQKVHKGLKGSKGIKGANILIFDGPNPCSGDLVVKVFVRKNGRQNKFGELDYCWCLVFREAFGDEYYLEGGREKTRELAFKKAMESYDVYLEDSER